MKDKFLPVRIQDVARVAGVSVSTVSRVLNGRSDVSAETYQRVQGIIDELGYSSNLAAKSMRSERTNVIGVILSDLTLSYCLEVVRGIEQVVKAHTYDLMVFSSNQANRSDDPTWERKVVAQLNGSIVDGIIAVTPTTAALPSHAPVVTVDPCDEGNFPSVISANREGTIEAVRYLIELGHCHIGFIGGRSSLLSARQRRQGYEEAHRLAALPLHPSYYVEGDFSTQTALIAARKLLTLPNRPSAIMAANDLSAFAVIEVANRLGISIPGELSLIGFDNLPESAYTSPALTTIEQPIGAMGRRAAELLIQSVEGKRVANDIYQLPTRLILRDSCQKFPPEPSYA